MFNHNILNLSSAASTPRSQYEEEESPEPIEPAQQVVTTALRSQGRSGSSNDHLANRVEPIRQPTSNLSHHPEQATELSDDLFDGAAMANLGNPRSSNQTQRTRPSSPRPERPVAEPESEDEAVSPPLSPRSPRLLENPSDPAEYANTSHADSPFEARARGQDTTRNNPIAEESAANPENDAEEPTLTISAQPMGEAFKEFVVTLDNGQRFRVTCLLEQMPANFQQTFKTLLEDTYARSQDTLSKPCLIHQGNVEDEIILRPETETNPAKFYKTTSKPISKFLQTNTIKNFKVEEFANYYTKTYSQNLEKPDSSKTKPENNTPPAEPTPSVKLKATLNQSEESTHTEETPKPSVKVKGTVSTSNENPVIIRHDRNSCYLASFLQAHVLKKDRLPQVIASLENQQNNFDNEVAKINESLEARKRNLAGSERILDPQTTAEFNSEIRFLEGKLKEIEERRTLVRDLLAFFNGISGKKEIDNIQDLFKILAKARPDQFIDDANAPNQGGRTRIGQQGDYNEVSTILTDLIYPPEWQTVPSPYTLQVTSARRVPISNRETTRSTTDRESSHYLDIPGKFYNGNQSVPFKNLYEESLVRKEGQIGSADISVPATTDYFVFDIKRLVGQTKYTGEIRDIPLFNSPDTEIAPLQNFSLDTSVCHEGTGSGWHYYVLQKAKGFMNTVHWVRKDDVPGNRNLSIAEARELAEKHAVQLIYHKNK